MGLWFVYFSYIGIVIDYFAIYTVAQPLAYLLAFM